MSRRMSELAIFSASPGCNTRVAVSLRCPCAPQVRRISGSCTLPLPAGLAARKPSRHKWGIPTPSPTLSYTCPCLGFCWILFGLIVRSVISQASTPAMMCQQRRYGQNRALPSVSCGAGTLKQRNTVGQMSMRLGRSVLILKLDRNTPGTHGASTRWFPSQSTAGVTASP